MTMLTVWTKHRGSDGKLVGMCLPDDVGVGIGVEVGDGRIHQYCSVHLLRYCGEVLDSTSISQLQRQQRILHKVYSANRFYALARVTQRNLN
jgi:hypothetical protein